MEELKLYTLSITLLALVLFYARHLIKWPKSSGRATSPPSPPALPIIGNLHQLGELPHRSLWELSRKYGPLMLLHFGPKPVLVVSSAEVARQIIKTHDLALSDRPDFKPLKKVFYDSNDVVNLPYGDQWRKMRNILVHELLSTPRVKTFSSIREEEMSLFVKKIEECSSSSSKPLDMTKMVGELMNDLISRAAFGKKHGEMEHGKKFLEVVEEGVGLLWNFSVGEFVPWLAWIDRLRGRDAALDKSFVKMDAIIDAIIEDHLKSSYTSDKENIMDILLDIYKGHLPSMSIDLISLKAMILDVIAVGTETTATILVWLLTELIRHPKAMKKLQDEIRGIMKGKEHITDDELQKMSYLKAVIKEAFRLHPPLAVFTRAAKEHVNIMGYEIAPKTMVMTNVWGIGRDPVYWDEPEKFMPERFFNSSIDFKGFDFELIPFGSGRRICPGLGFATVSLEHTVANLMLKFDWALPNGARGEDLDVTERMGFTTGKKTHLIVVATRVKTID